MAPRQVARKYGVEDDERLSAHGHGLGDWDIRHHAAVVELAPVDAYRWEDTGNCRAGQ